MAMAYTYAHDHVFDVPLARRVRRRRDVADVFRDRAHAELIDLEFSEYGRCSRFLPGWYILPGIVAGVIVIASVLLVV
jgi:hypothetical protein